MNKTPTLIAGLLATTLLHGQTWTGTTDDDWNTGTNWNPNAVPDSATADVLFDASDATPTVNLSAPVTINSIKFTDETNPIDISGSSITFGGTGSNNLWGNDVSLTISNDVVLSSGQSGNLNINLASGTINLNGIVSGSLNVRKGGGSGTLVLGNAANTFTGDIKLEGGNVSISDGAALGNAANKILYLGSSFQRSLFVTADTTITNDIQLDNDNNDAARIVPSAGVTATFSTNSIVRTTTNGTTDGGVVEEFDHNGGSGSTVKFTGDALTVANNINFNTNTSTIRTLEFGPPSGTQEWQGVIRNGGNVAKSGAGTTTLSGANTYSGNTTVSEGILVASNDKSLGDSPSVTINGGTLDVRGSTAGTLTIGDDASLALSSGTISLQLGTVSDQIVSSGAAVFTISGGTLDLDISDPGFDYNNSYTVLSGFGGANSVAGLTITGHDTVNYTATLDTSGVLSFSFAPESFTWDGSEADGLWNTGDNWNTGIAPADNTGTSIIFDGTGTVPASIALATDVTVGDFTFTGETSNITLNGAGVITMDDGSQSNNFLSTTNPSVDFTIDNNMVLTSGNGNLINFNSRGLITLNGDLSGVAGIRKTGAGNMTLTGNNSYTGITRIDANNLQIDEAAALGTGEVRLNSPGGSASNLAIETSTTIANDLNFTATGSGDTRIRPFGGETATFSTDTITALDATQELEILRQTGGSLTTVKFTGTALSTSVNVNIFDENHALELAPSSGTQTWSGVIRSEGDGGAVLKSDAGAVTLSGINTYDGDTTVTGGTLTLADDAGLRFVIGANGVNNQIAGSATVNLDGDFTFDLTGADLTDGNSWTIVDVSTLTETFGATFQVVGFSESSDVWTFVDGSNTWTFTEATGVLSLTVGASGPTDDDNAQTESDFIDTYDFDGTTASGSFAGYAGADYQVLFTDDLSVPFAPLSIFPGPSDTVSGTGTSGTAGVAIPWSHDPGTPDAFYRVNIITP